MRILTAGHFRSSIRNTGAPDPPGIPCPERRTTAYGPSRNTPHGTHAIQNRRTLLQYPSPSHVNQKEGKSAENAVPLRRMFGAKVHSGRGGIFSTSLAQDTHKQFSTMTQDPPARAAGSPLVRHCIDGARRRWASRTPSLRRY